ncbi:MAG: TolC family outer membrane protein [Phenylobacterium sp.]|uniref:TolC family outer membrane protein n=1 Tax=Phenylobacterium sp. TaxID=1871053 RepID=UPI00391B4C42
MFTSRRTGLMAAACVASLIGALAATPVSAETLADAIALAYESNPTLQAQRATQRALDESVVQARAGWRPTLSVSGQTLWSQSRSPGVSSAGVDTNGDGIPDSGVVNATTEGSTNTATLTLAQPIWTGGRVGAAVSAAEADILAGRESLRRVEAQVLASVIQAYVDVRRDQQALAIRQENVKVLQRQLEESNARFEVGEITRTDVAQSEARLAAAQAQLRSAQAQLAVSRASYAAVVGQNPGELAPEPSLAGLLPADVDVAFDVAEQNNPQIRAAEYAAQASRARVTAAKAERMPSVSIGGTLGWTGLAEPFEPSDYQRNLTGRATLTVPLFTGGLTNSRVRAQIERNNADRIGIESARRSVLQSVTQSWNELLAARANIGSSQEQVRAATIAAEGTRQEQQVGLRTTIDVLNAEQELRSAQLSQVNAVRDEYVAAASVLFSMGRLEAQNLTPTLAVYDPKTNFKKLRITWGWVPWEEPIGVVDSVFVPKTDEKPREPTVTIDAPPPAPAATPEQ